MLNIMNLKNDIPALIVRPLALHSDIDLESLECPTLFVH